MDFNRSSNPIFGRSAFSNSGSYATGDTMTVQGTIAKTALMLALVVVSATITWKMVLQNAGLEGAGFGVAAPFVFGGLIVGFIAALVMIFKKEWSPYLAPVYAIAQGLFLGGVSAVFNSYFPGIVVNAIGLTFGVFAIMLVLYRTRIIQPTKKFVMVVVAATGAIALVYLMSWILSIFNVQIPGIFGSGIVGIGFSIVVVVVAALNLIIDFGNIEEGANSQQPRYMEWYTAFGLMVTLIWLYLEILRLLAKLRD